MKLSKEQLKLLIVEELKKVLNEDVNPEFKKVGQFEPVKAKIDTSEYPITNKFQESIKSVGYSLDSIAKLYHNTRNQQFVDLYDEIKQSKQKLDNSVKKLLELEKQYEETRSTAAGIDKPITRKKEFGTTVRIDEE